MNWDINTVLIHGRSGRGNWRVSSAAIGRAPQKAGPKQPPTTHAYSLHEFTSILKAVRKALCLYCDQTTRGEELQENNTGNLNRKLHFSSQSRRSSYPGAH